MRFRGEGVHQEFTRKLFHGQIENCGKYKKLVTEGIENAYTLEKLNTSGTPIPKGVTLKVVTRLNDLTDKQYITTKNYQESPEEKKQKERNQSNKNYITIQIGNYKADSGETIEPLLKENGSTYYWYFARQNFDCILVMKTRTDCYNYWHYKGNSYNNGSMKTIYLPVKEQVISDLNKAESNHYEIPSPISYGRKAAHEMGHALGLDDAYAYAVGDVEISRVSDDLNKNNLIMKKSFECKKVSSLEILMLLYAKSQSFDKSEIS